MNLIDKLRQKNVVDTIANTDWSVGTCNPLVVELDTTEACDMACPGCISEDIMMASGRFSKQRLLEIGQELFDAGVKAVVLIGGGEPLAHPGVGDLIQFLGAHDVHIGITTNGTLLLDIPSGLGFLWMLLQHKPLTSCVLLKVESQNSNSL